MKVLQENGLKAFMISILNKFIKKTDTEQVSTIDIDATPTASSNNLVTSGGVASALSDKQDVIDNNNKLPYTLLSDTPTIPTVPTNVSSFNNDAGYLTLQTLPVYNGGVQ